MRELEMGVMLLLLGCAGLLYGIAYIFDNGPVYRDPAQPIAARDTMVITANH
jgi:hypothetical protein